MKKFTLISPSNFYVKLLLLIHFGVFSSIIFAQHPLLDRLSLSEYGGKVYISCIIKSGSTCNGIAIFRSVDGIDFQPIGKIIGVCGDINTPVGYDFVDENPIVNKINQYKLELGGYGFTDIISINIIDNGEFGFQVRPNPVSQKATIFFNNDQSEETILNLYNLSGEIILNQKTKNNVFELEVSKLPAGLYFFELNQNKAYFKKSGRIMVLPK